jgi:hypothetical protein
VESNLDTSGSKVNRCYRYVEVSVKRLPGTKVVLLGARGLCNEAASDVVSSGRSC